ncbi:hypothetical protein JAAARDRAFT_401680 [Jaapia argillacea MUCL 33604]|uniref:Uncharacterized protein n=1 Tax=Jaapia argillacea MUCL 33604 TaxID=933084 RepID=A0A067PWG3_9AGAM|nr:hypothetical protein JAAARDRAFT_401680 [Jaapia argillacea MUCL 33604]
MLPSTWSNAVHGILFAATLILLLSISAAIVFRSLIIRHRHRRAVREAIANGTYIPGVWPPPLESIAAARRGPGGRGTKADIGEKPKFFEASVSNWEAGDAKTWDGMLPVCATVISPSAALALPVPPPAVKSSPFFTRMGGGRRTQSSSPSQPPSPGLSRSPSQLASQNPISSPTPLPSPSALLPTQNQAQVTVLIAMPSAYSPHHRPPLPHTLSASSSTMSFADIKGKQKVDVTWKEGYHAEDAEEEIPVVELGVASVCLPDGVDLAGIKASSGTKEGQTQQASSGSS